MGEAQPVSRVGSSTAGGLTVATVSLPAPANPLPLPALTQQPSRQMESPVCAFLSGIPGSSKNPFVS